ncbi:DUF1145 domain-containing protein [Pseudidiomarina sp.]|uniref:DUF1145 domain-containing protein n=1 Tax=Pseudidiomarina sp. TaxID=2081707 RepID=UPI00299F0E64|nr:DUF1145 domain-containing protein [Pseudidiomarina sp.]MDX1706353.1 DUF1145 domain-containing protein [Pseudidiomarina sp.]
MSISVWLGRILFALVWGALLANLVWPFPGKGFALFLILLFVLLAIHLLQLLMFVTVYGDKIKWQRGDYLQVIVFGVIGWLAVLQKQPRQNTD